MLSIIFGIIGIGLVYQLFEWALAFLLYMIPDSKIRTFTHIVMILVGITLLIMTPGLFGEKLITFWQRCWWIYLLFALFTPILYSRFLDKHMS